jgi:hypothetical protein
MMHACAVGRTHVLDILAMLALLLGALLTSAQAAAPPEIRHFEADPVDVLGPGTELSFRLEGTPKAQATVSMSGIKQPIPLRETEVGVYEGRYTIRQTETLPRAPVVRATLRQGSLATTTQLSQPLGSAAPAPTRAPAIQRFTMAPERIEPGTELVLTLEGTPQGKASFTIDKITRGVAMAEIQPGVYEGRYTVRRQDRFAAADVSAALEAQGQVARARLSGATRPSAQRDVPLEFTSPADMSEVGSGAIEVRGRSAPHQSLQVVVEAITAVGGITGLNQNILTRTITTDDRGQFAFTFEPRLPVPVTRYEVRVSGTVAGQEHSRTLTLVRR